jgi:hypothetical protein
MMKKELIGINKNKSSKINLLFADNELRNYTFFNQVDGDIFPKLNAKMEEELGD